MGIEAIELEMRWSLKRPGASDIRDVIERLGALPAAEADGFIRLAQDAHSIRVQAQPPVLEAGHLSASLAAVRDWSRRLNSSIRQNAIRSETFHLYLFTSGLANRRTLKLLSEVGGPSLLLLLGRHQEGAMSLEVRDDVFHLMVPYGLDPDRAAMAVPIVTGMLVALLRDAWRGILPRSLLRHPDLVAMETPLRWSLQLQQNAEPVLRDGPLTRLAAVTVDGKPVKVYAQQSLTVLYLYAEAEVLRLVPPRVKRWVKTAVVGERDLSNVSRRAPSTTQVQPRDERGVTAGGRGGSPVRAAASVAARHLILVIVQTGPDPVPADLWAARAMSERFGLEVLLCPWYNLELVARAVLISGTVLRVSGNLVQPIVIARQQAREVDMLFFTGASGGEPAGRLPAEQQPFRRLVSMGVIGEDVSRFFLVDQLLAEASRRGVVTNAVGRPRAWGPKHELELRLRAYRRATGRRFPHPETFIAARAQLPTVLKSFARRGVDCIVKPAFGAWGAGSRAVRPDSAWHLGSNAQQFVVQQLVPRPMLLGGHKVDLRCHVAIDVDNRQRSRPIPPVLIRRAGVAYRRGKNDAEINNLTYQRLHRLRSTIMPIEEMPGISVPIREAILRQLDHLSEQLIDAYFLWMESVRGRHPEWIIPSRVLLWGLDVGISRTNRSVRLLVLENNARPQLRRSVASCDRAMAAMLRSSYLPMAIRSRLDSGSRRIGVEGGS